MRKKRRTEITIETEQILVLRGRKSSVSAWCNNCAEQVIMVTPDEAAALARVSSRAICRWVEMERLHFRETPEGALFICLNSLAD